MKPTADNAIEVLKQLADRVGTPSLAFWIAPNSILTLAGARAYCDGVFYDEANVGGKQLEVWQNEINESIDALKLVTDVYISADAINTSPGGDRYAGYDLVFREGLKYSLDQNTLFKPHSAEVLKANFEGATDMMAYLRKIVGDAPTLTDLDEEDRNHVAFGMLVGYPERAIIESVRAWKLEAEDDPFAQRTVNADIRGADYYDCPQPIYSYPRRLMNDKDIQQHEELWNGILKDFYVSDFHGALIQDKGFRKKVLDLDLHPHWAST